MARYSSTFAKYLSDFVEQMTRKCSSSCVSQRLARGMSLFAGLN